MGSSTKSWSRAGSGYRADRDRWARGVSTANGTLTYLSRCAEDGVPDAGWHLYGPNGIPFGRCQPPSPRSEIEALDMVREYERP